MPDTQNDSPLITNRDAVTEVTVELEIITDKTIPCPNDGVKLVETASGKYHSCPKCHTVWTAAALIEARKGPAT